MEKEVINGRKKQSEEKERCEEAAQTKEVLAYFTALMRGDVWEEKIEADPQTGEERVLRQPVKVADRTKAAEFLAKYFRMLEGVKDDAPEDGRICVELKGKVKEWAE